MYKFPYDTQICHLYIGNVIEPDSITNASVDPITDFNLNFYSPSNEFDLISKQVNRMPTEVGRIHFIFDR